MHLIQIFLPLHDNDKIAFTSDTFAQTRQELVDTFGGLTAFLQSPAQGLWQHGSTTSHDALALFEIMAAKIDPMWWADYRTSLEKRFRQDKILIRTMEITQL